MPLTTVEYQQFMQTVHQIRDVYVEMDKEIKRQGGELNKLSDMEKVSIELKDQQARLEDTLHKFEAEMQRPPAARSGEESEENKQKQELKQKKEAFFKAMRHGYDLLAPEEKQLVPKANALDAPPINVKAFPTASLVSAEDTAGGLFAPPEFVADIIKGYIQYSPIRQYAKIRNTTNRSIQQPKRTGTITASWVGEKTERQVLTGYTLLNHPDIPIIKSGTNSVPVADTLIDCLYNLPDIYASTAVWGMRRSVVATVRKLKYAGGEQSYVWQPGIGGAAPNTILGVPYIELPDMPAAAAGSNSMMLGDLSKAYTIVQRVGMSFKRLAERWVEDSLIGIYARMRVGGQVTLPEAMRIYQFGP